MMSVAVKNSRRAKRKQVNRNESLVKKPKQSSEDEQHPIEMTDLNVDCLEHIFGHLNVSDLCCVAEANSHFISAARLVYKRMNGEKTVEISESSHILSVYKKSQTFGDIVDATAASFLNNFGDLIKKLELNYMNVSMYNDAHHWRTVEKVIMNHCIESLTEINLRNCRGNVMEEIHVPFKNVVCLSVADDFDLQTNIRLDHLFPNTRQLQLDGSALEFANDWKFNHLRKLHISVLDCGSNAYANVQNLLRMNCHIRKLAINFNHNRAFVDNFNFLQFLSETMTQLEDVRFHHMRMSFINTAKHIHFKHVKSLEIQTIGNFPENVTITFDELKSLRLYQVNGSDDKWLEFIVQNKNLDKLGFFPYMHHSEQTVDGLLRITTKMPHLKEIQFQARSISPDVLKRFVHQCKHAGHPTVIRLKFFDGFKNDRNEYMAMADEKCWEKLCQSKVSGDEIIFRNRRIKLN